MSEMKKEIEAMDYSSKLRDKIWKGIVNKEILVIKEQDRRFAEPALEAIARLLNVRILARTNRSSNELYIYHNSNIRGSRTVKVLVLDRESMEIANKFPEYEVIGGIVIPETSEYLPIPPKPQIKLGDYFDGGVIKSPPSVMYNDEVKSGMEN